MGAEDNGYRFDCTGKSFYAYFGVIGLGPDLNISEGYDSSIFESDKFTKEERLELAEHMASLWKTWGWKDEPSDS